VALEFNTRPQASLNSGKQGSGQPILSHEQLSTYANRVADFLQHKRPIEFTDEPATFELNGTHYQEAGHYKPSTGKILMRTPVIKTNRDLDLYLPHEIMHHKYNVFNKLADKEHTVLDSLSDEDFDKLNDPAFADKHFPASSARMKHEFHERAELEKSDGVTQYSRDHWQHLRNNKNPTLYEQSLPRNETLAEIAKLHYLQHKTLFNNAVRDAQLKREFYKDPNMYDLALTHAYHATRKEVDRRLEIRNGIHPKWLDFFNDVKRLGVEPK
jgi:hypothetical protein